MSLEAEWWGRGSPSLTLHETWGWAQGLRPSPSVLVLVLGGMDTTCTRENRWGW